MKLKDLILRGVIAANKGGFTFFIDELPNGKDRKQFFDKKIGTISERAANEMENLINDGTLLKAADGGLIHHLQPFDYRDHEYYIKKGKAI